MGGPRELASYWERKVGDTAHQIVEWALAEGDTPLAEATARKGLLACPLNETLTEDLARAYEAAGETSTEPPWV